MRPVKLRSWHVPSSRKSAHTDFQSVRTTEEVFMRQFGKTLDQVEAFVVGQHTLSGLVCPIALICHYKIKVVMTRIMDIGEWEISVVSEKPIDLSGVVPFWRTEFPEGLTSKVPSTGEIICRRRLGLWSKTNSYRFRLVVQNVNIHTIMTLVLSAYNRAA